MEIPQPYAITNDVWMVPCKINCEANEYSPLSFPNHPCFRNSSIKYKRKFWNEAEDEVLLELTKKEGPQNWSSIAKQLNIRVHQSYPIRKGKQCRERYLNQLSSNLGAKPWLKFEDDIIEKMQKELGNKWSEISKFLEGRNENQVKNRWKKIKKCNARKYDISANEGKCFGTGWKTEDFLKFSYCDKIGNYSNLQENFFELEKIDLSVENYRNKTMNFQSNDIILCLDDDQFCGDWVHIKKESSFEYKTENGLFIDIFEYADKVDDLVELLGYDSINSTS